MALYSEQEMQEWKQELDQQEAEYNTRVNNFNTSKKTKIANAIANLRGLDRDIQRQIEALEIGKFFGQSGPIYYFTGEEEPISNIMDSLREVIDEAWDIYTTGNNIQSDKEEYERELASMKPSTEQTKANNFLDKMDEHL